MITDVMTKAKKSRIDAMQLALHRASTGYLPLWSIQYWAYNSRLRVHIFKIRMPLTDNWELIHVSDQHLQLTCVPREVFEKIDYFVSMRKLLERARDHAPMNVDLTPITPEEKALFGVRPRFNKLRKLDRDRLNAEYARLFPNR